jgi:hypothetical protein
MGLAVDHVYTGFKNAILLRSTDYGVTTAGFDEHPLVSKILG